VVVIGAGGLGLLGGGRLVGLLGGRAGIDGEGRVVEERKGKTVGEETKGGLGDGVSGDNSMWHG